MRTLLSNTRRSGVWSAIITWICAGLFCVTAASGCASGPQPTDTGEGEKKKREPQAPSPEKLASSPCGNPDWGSLPEEHAIDGDPAPAESQNGASDTNGADTEGRGESEAMRDDADETDGSVGDKQKEGGD